MEDMNVLVVLPNDFPHADVLVLGEILMEAEVLVPGFVPAPAGLCNPVAIRFEQTMHEADLYFLPDRNLVSRIARVGLGESVDEHRRLAACLMAFAQCTNINFEPGVAFHELAYGSGNEVACNELRAFRAADQASPEEWVDVALGRTPALAPRAGALNDEIRRDLAKPPRRWTRNYVLALKVAQLELLRMDPVAKVLKLLEWMYSDFIVGGPAFLMASLYFAPNRPGRLLKGLRSPDRKRALDGVRNAAWDITYLSEFVRRIQMSAEEGDKRRYILATADRELARIAGSLFQYGEEIDDREMLAGRLSKWWPREDAVKITDAFWNCVSNLSDAARQINRDIDVVAQLTEIGERHLLDWTTSTPHRSS